MEIEVLKDEKGVFEFKLKGETHTLLNVLTKEIIKDKDIDFAGYNVPHPLINEAIVSVSGKSPKKAVKEAVSAIEAELKKFNSCLKNL